MTEDVRITHIEQDGEDGLIVTFSDETTGAYVVEELLMLRPIREPVRVVNYQSLQAGPATET